MQELHRGVDHAAVLENHGRRDARAAVVRTFAVQRLLHELANARALDAERLRIREVDEVGDKARANQLEQAHRPGHRPAVDP